jgi:hypothetical protein
MKTCFDAATKDQLRLLLSILEAAKYIRRAEGEFWEVENREESLLEYKDFDINKIISAVSFYYSKYDRAVLDRLSRRAP